mmetsp:Transcript_23120/g.72487  ORF Transcript_23120/g.72487 Transcript_23120/m.72487 type:complete len:98 (-) Transcript_23120:72-365(-)
MYDGTREIRALMCASEPGQNECAQLLIKCGATVGDDVRATPCFQELVAQGRVHVCFGCDRCATKMPKCARCQLVRFCNMECMAAGWQAHRHHCSREP